MKNILKSLAIFALAALAFGANAQTYAYTNPTYIPNAVDPTVTLTAPGTDPFVINGIGTLTVRVSGTCTSLAGTLQASNDNGTNFTAINLYPIATGTSAPTAVASISAPGFWKANVSGFNLVRVNVTALTATCTISMVGSPHGFNGVSF
jgi:hypothetical protein